MRQVIDSLSVPDNINIDIQGNLATVLFKEPAAIQLWQNLLSNAIKFMDKPEGRIKISCKEEDNCYTFSVEDNGRGIAEKDLKSLFKMFFMAKEQESSEYSGIGLAVVKRIIDLCGGEIQVESRIGKGSKFYFKIPKK